MFGKKSALFYILAVILVCACTLTAYAANLTTTCIIPGTNITLELEKDWIVLQNETPAYYTYSGVNYSEIWEDMEQAQSKVRCICVGSSVMTIDVFHFTDNELKVEIRSSIDLVPIGETSNVSAQSAFELVVPQQIYHDVMATSDIVHTSQNDFRLSFVEGNAKKDDGNEYYLSACIFQYDGEVYTALLSSPRPLPNESLSSFFKTMSSIALAGSPSFNRQETNESDLAPLEDEESHLISTEEDDTTTGRDVLLYTVAGLAVIGLAFIFISLIHAIGPITDRVEDKWNDTGKLKYRLWYYALYLIGLLLILLCIFVLPGTILVGLIEGHESRKTYENAIRDYKKGEAERIKSLWQ